MENKAGFLKIYIYIIFLFYRYHSIFLLFMLAWQEVGGQEGNCVAESVTGRTQGNKDKLNRRCVWVRSPGAASDSSSFPSSSSGSSLFCCRVSWWHTSNAWPTVRTILMAWDCNKRQGDVTACVRVCLCECCSRASRAIGDEKKVDIKVEKTQQGKKRGGRGKWPNDQDEKKWLQREDVPPPSPAVAMMNWPVSKSSGKIKFAASAGRRLRRRAINLRMSFLLSSITSRNPSKIPP